MKHAICVFVVLLTLTSTLEATQRCSGVTAQPVTVDSGQSFSLPTVVIPNTVDYVVSEASEWTIVAHDTWSPKGTVLTQTVHAGSTPPVVRQTLFNPSSPGRAVYFVVVATNPSSSFVPCAQDFLVTVNPDTSLARDASRMVVPVAGSLHGANNSLFRTRLLLHNPWNEPVSGELVFHPTGAAASSSDPAAKYSIPAGSSINYDDVVASLKTTGLGSIDIVPDQTVFGMLVPTARAQIISVAAAGSYQTDLPVVTMDGIYNGALWTSPSRPHLALDTTGTKRLSIGVRTLSDPVTVSAYLLDANATVRETVTRSYPADYHEQQALSLWFSTTPASGDALEIFAFRTNKALAGGAIVYLTETDNSTNDVTVLVGKAETTSLATPVISCSPLCTVLR